MCESTLHQFPNSVLLTGKKVQLCQTNKKRSQKDSIRNDFSIKWTAKSAVRAFNTALLFFGLSAWLWRAANQTRICRRRRFPFVSVTPIKAPLKSDEVLPLLLLSLFTVCWNSFRLFDTAHPDYTHTPSLFIFTFCHAATPPSHTHTPP